MEGRNPITYTTDGHSPQEGRVIWGYCLRKPTAGKAPQPRHRQRRISREGKGLLGNDEFSNQVEEVSPLNRLMAATGTGNSPVSSFVYHMVATRSLTSTSCRECSAPDRIKLVINHPHVVVPLSEQLYYVVALSVLASFGRLDYVRVYFRA